MNETEQIIKKLDEQREHAALFREELKLGLNTVSVKLQDLVEHQKIANGRTGKLEDAVNNLRETDILMGEKIKNIKDGGKLIGDRLWMVIVGVSIAVIITFINKIIK